MKYTVCLILKVLLKPRLTVYQDPYGHGPVWADFICGDDLTFKIHGWITHGPSPEWQLTDRRRSGS